MIFRRKERKIEPKPLIKERVEFLEPLSLAEEAEREVIEENRNKGRPTKLEEL